MVVVVMVGVFMRGLLILLMGVTTIDNVMRHVVVHQP
jgi:hypothetical protein